MNDTISHHTLTTVPSGNSTHELVNQALERLEARKDELHLPFEETKRLLFELTEFGLGRFLLHNKGLNGYWTSYIFRNEVDRSQLTPLEDWLLNQSLYVMARERFHRFQQLIQQRLHSNMTLASIPCGLMDDLLGLDYTGLKNIQLVGIDADTESLKLARDNAAQSDLQGNEAVFRQRDAWNLGLSEEIDLIVSNGLNMYEASEARLIELYRQMNQALTQGGQLIISFIPPLSDDADIHDIGMTEYEFLTERAIFDDIIQVNYLNFCTEDNMRLQLQAAGFEVDRVVYNAKGMAPVAVASK